MESIKKLIFVPVKFYQSKSKYSCLLLKSNNKFIFVPVNGINEKEIFVPIIGINQIVNILPVNGINENVNICAC